MKIAGVEITLNEIEKIWYKDKFLGILVILSFLAGIHIGNTVFSDSNLNFIKDNFFLIKIFCGDFFAALVYILWKLSRKRPKVSKHKIGILIAIRDNTPEALKIKQDVIDKFKDITQSLPIENIIEIIEVKDFFTKKITNYREALDFLIKSRGHFIVYGNTLNYEFQGNDQYEFDLSFTVRHAEFDDSRKSVLMQHFNESVFNKQWRFLEENPFTIINVTANNVREIALFIIGAAAFLSFDTETGFKFHKSLHEIFLSDDEKKRSLNSIYKRNRSYLADENMLMGLVKSISEPSNLEVQKEALEINEQGLLLADNPYPMLVNKAKYCFQLNDIDGAKAAIKLVRRLHARHTSLVFDSTWRYSEAFLFFYDEKFPEGKRAYRKAISGFVTDFTVDSVIIFTEDHLVKNPSAIQFLYALGIVYYYKKSNNPQALVNFEKFVVAAQATPILEERFKDLLPDAQRLLISIRREMGLPLLLTEG